MNSFIRTAEIWVPAQDDTLLEFAGGFFGAAKSFGAATRSLCFGRGEGLPGQAWEEGRPILLKDFDSLHFHRTAAAKTAGLSCAVALPIFTVSSLKAVLVLFCGSDEARAGGIELWHNNPRITSDMTLVDGFYGTATSDAFAALSKDTFLPRGTGLPGLAWQRGAAVFMEDLGTAARFLRGETAAQAGITRGLALPCPTRTEEVYVMTWLSALGTPLAQRLESWAPDAARQQLQRGFDFSETPGEPASAAEGIALDDVHAPIARAFVGGVPVISESTGGGLGLSLVAIPVVSEGEVSEVLALYL
ncbi:MAG: GAF domain-containing protein [Rubrivivax sp.]|nr:MAG: GAF domain-containing protein [Rubrivivax sp.]